MAGTCKRVLAIYYFRQEVYNFHYFSLRITRDPGLAQDCTMAAFIKLYNNRKKINDESHLKRFLYVVARNYCFQHLRDEKVQLQAELELSYILQDHQVMQDDPEIDLNETLIKLHKGISMLSPQRRQVIEYSFFQNLKVREIARAMNIKEQTVRNHLSESILLLRRYMAS